METLSYPIDSTITNNDLQIWLNDLPKERCNYKWRISNLDFIPLEILSMILRFIVLDSIDMIPTLARVHSTWRNLLYCDLNMWRVLLRRLDPHRKLSQPEIENLVARFGWHGLIGSLHNRNCVGCKERTPHFFSLKGCRVCEKCFTSRDGPFALCTRTFAANCFKLAKRDTDKIACIAVSNAFETGLINVVKSYLVLVEDAKNLAVRKYGSLEELAKIKESQRELLTTNTPKTRRRTQQLASEPEPGSESPMKKRKVEESLPKEEPNTNYPAMNQERHFLSSPKYGFHHIMNESFFRAQPDVLVGGEGPTQEGVKRCKTIAEAVDAARIGSVIGIEEDIECDVVLVTKTVKLVGIPKNGVVPSLKVSDNAIILSQPACLENLKIVSGKKDSLSSAMSAEQLTEMIFAGIWCRQDAIIKNCDVIAWNGSCVVIEKGKSVLYDNKLHDSPFNGVSVTDSAVVVEMEGNSIFNNFKAYEVFEQGSVPSNSHVLEKNKFFNNSKDKTREDEEVYYKKLLKLV